ncbi:hypothetical protein BKA62DRAFT_318892 [Auriculariales sp. MPI-PUGE-AT-0066]|nr:hypothetical protein BKA62DRAFT_318892 [Auriculariales sp. MPI-PUGE-AT-0066]
MALDLDAGQWLILVFIFGLIVLGFVHHGEQTRLAHQRQRTPVRRATTPLRIDPRFAVKGNYFHTLGDDISSESGPAGRLGIVEVDPPTPAPAPKRPIAEQLDIKPSPDTAAQAGASKPHSSLAAQPQGSQTSLPANSVTQLISLPVKTKPFTRSAARAVSNNDTASGSGSNNATASGAAFAPAPSSHAPTEEKKPEWSPVILIDLKEVAGHFDHISESMGVLARLNANELVEQAKNYNPPRTTTPFKSRNALPSDATRGVAEEIMSYDNGLARAEDEWVEKGYANQIGLFAQYENVRLAGLRSAGEGFQWLPAPGPPTPTLPAVDLATHKIVSHIHIEDWRVDTGTVADNEKLDKERARVETEYDVDEKSKIPVAARFMRRSPPPADAWDGVVRNNNKTGHGILVKDDNGEIINPERVNARKRKRQLDPEEASRHVKFRLESTAMSHPRPRGSAFDGRSDPNQQPRPEAVLATLPFLQLNNEELVTLARYVPPGKLPRKAVRSNKYYWNKYMQRIKAYIAAIKAMSELSHELKLKPIEAFITGEYLPLSQEVPDYVLEDEDPFEVACEPDDYEYEYEYSEDEDEAEVDGVPYGDPKKRSTMNKESVFDGASTLSLLADETDDFYWSGLEKRMRRCFRSSFAVFEHLKLLEIFNITDPRRKESQAALHRAMLFSYACDYSRLDDANLDTLIKNGFNHTNPFVDIGVTEFDEEDGVPSSTFEAIKRYVDIRRANRAANKATSFEEIAALAGIFPRGGIVGDAAVNVETMHPLLYRRIGACCDMIHYAFMRRGSALERLGKNAPLEDEVEWHATFAAVALALTFGPDDLADVGATVLDPDSDASTTTAAGATVAPSSPPLPLQDTLLLRFPSPLPLPPPLPPLRPLTPPRPPTTPP